jgi:plasmid maintenance system killer protein
MSSSGPRGESIVFPYFLLSARGRLTRRYMIVILGRLHAARQPKDMKLPGLRLHELKGERSGTWAVDVSGNERITFRFEGEDVSMIFGMLSRTVKSCRSNVLSRPS